MAIDPAVVQKCLGASTIYFAGYNDGVAEELTLKTNEITRRSPTTSRALTPYTASRK